MNWREEVDKFKSDLEVQTSTIDTDAIRFGFFGSVGGGKSVTAGIFSIGITPKGDIGWVDGEGKRSGWAIDVVATMAAEEYGGTQDEWIKRFKIIHIDPPFHPLRVVAAIEQLESSGCKTIILDILTQCWDSDGGYLDMKEQEIDRMAKDDDSKRDKVAAAASAHIKRWTHHKLVNKINASKSNLVLLFQAKQKYNAKTFRPDDFESPIQESGLTRTAIAVGRVSANDQGEGGYCSFSLPRLQGTKTTHPDILKAMPANGERFTFQHASAVLRLCGGVPATIAVKSTKKAETMSKFKKKMFTRLANIGGEEFLKSFAEDKGWIHPADDLSQWPEIHVPRSKEAMETLEDSLEAFKSDS